MGISSKKNKRIVSINAKIRTVSLKNGYHYIALYLHHLVVSCSVMLTGRPAGEFKFASRKTDDGMSVNLTLQKIYFCFETLGGANMAQYHGSHFSKETILAKIIS